MLGFARWLVKMLLVLPVVGLLGLWDRVRLGRKIVVRVALGPAGARPRDRVGDLSETVELLHDSG